ncbi:T3SS (YopN, CesT) and YbjN peptide-binding chaperone 1 [Actinocorallia longicatena]|uniref:TY-Chap central domain-containing protein n=1 Tax=Actinocorallia longicatena TaxID=111803 RepID=A0ABP6QNY9_9ACTN
MAYVEMARAYVEKLLMEVLKTDSLKVDSDGDVPIRHGSSVAYVRVTQSGNTTRVRVFAEVLRGVEGSPELYEKLNEINGGILGARIYHRHGIVTLSAELLPENLQVEELRFAVDCVTTLADDLDDDLHGLFGGEKAVDDDHDRAVEI